MSYLSGAKKLITGFFGMAILLTSTTAIATPITGGISFTGYASYIDGGGSVTTGIEDARGLDFIYASTAAWGGADGSYASIVWPAIPIISVTFQDFTFSPFTGPITPLWTFDDADSPKKTYDFEMTSMAIITQTSSELHIMGSGFLGITGYDDTEGNWSFTSQAATKAGVMSFSSNSVPEPGSMLLLGTGLMGLVFYRRKRVDF